MTAATATIPEFGSTVRYFGSIESCHGPAVLVDWCDCAECWDLNLTRYVLLPATGGQLTHVRTRSFA